jgi:hypothetical protein
MMLTKLLQIGCYKASPMVCSRNAQQPRQSEPSYGRRLLSTFPDDPGSVLALIQQG